MELLSNLLLVLSLVILLAGFGGFYIWYRRHGNTLKQISLKTERETKVIKQQIKLADNKIVELEIRVGILEDKPE